MPPCVEYCLSNVSGDVRRRLAEATVEAVESNCLEHCGHCYRRPFLVVDGEFVAGGSHERLLLSAVDADPSDVPGTVACDAGETTPTAGTGTSDP